jgi:hypothetical protein
LRPRQIRALRKTSGTKTFYVFLNMNNFLIDLATNGGRRVEVKKMAGVANNSSSSSKR